MDTKHILSSEEINLITKYRALAKREKQCIRDFAEALGRRWENAPIDQSSIPVTDSIRKKFLFARHGQG